MALISLPLCINVIYCLHFTSYAPFSCFVTTVLVVKFEREKFYPGPAIEPGPLALRASALPLRHAGQLPIQGRINLFVPILSDLRTATNSVVLRNIEACIHIFE